MTMKQLMQRSINKEITELETKNRRREIEADKSDRLN